MRDIHSGNQDFFTERLYKQNRRLTDYIRLGLMATLSIAVVLLSVLLSRSVLPLVPVVLIGWFLLARLIYQTTDREVELILTNGMIDVDVIMGRRRRRRLLSMQARDVEQIARWQTAADYEAAVRGCIRYDCAAEAESETNYFMIGSVDGRKTSVLFTPDAVFLERLKPFIRRQFWRE